MSKVLITGIGMVSPLGLTRDESFNAAIAAKSAIAAAPAPILKWLPQALAAQVPVAFEAGIARADAGLDRATLFSLRATAEAFVDAGFAVPEGLNHRIGIYVGVGMGGAYTLDYLYTRFFEQLQRADAANRDPTVLHPLAVPRRLQR